MITPSLKAVLRHTLALSLITAWSGAAIAQQATDAKDNAVSDQANDIIVTAQKRDQKLQDVGVTISAFTGAQLAQSGIKTSADVVKLTPGVNTAGTFAGQMLTYSIRGVTQADFSDHTEAPNAVYMDEGYVAAQQGQSFGLFDIERVEVLKGPQSTLFGRNATGGAISFFSKKPTDTFEGYAFLEGGSYRHLRFESAFSGPLSENIDARLSLLAEHNGDYLKNHYPGADSEGRSTNAAARLQFQIRASDSTSVNLIFFGGITRSSTAPFSQVASITQLDGTGRYIDSFVAGPSETREAIGPGGTNVDISGDGVALTRPTPGGDFYGYRARPGWDVDVAKTDRDFGKLGTYGATAKVNIDLSDTVSLTSISDAKHYDKLLGTGFDASPVSTINSSTDAHLTQASEELRLNGNSAPFVWVAGAYYIHITEKTPVLATVIIPSGLEFRDTFAQQSDSFAVYGQGELALDVKLSFILGGRVSRDTKKFQYASNLFARSDAWISPDTASFIAPIRSYAASAKETLYAGKIQLNWKPVRDILVYAGYNRGVKGGGFSAPLAGSAFAFIPDSELNYKPETLHSFEIGIKTTLLNGLMTVNGSAFYYDYKNYQAFRLRGITSNIINADATTKGAEIEIAARPVSGLRLTLNGSYVDMKVKDISVDGIIADRRNAYTPKFQTAGTARYSFGAFGGQVSIQGTGRYTSGTFASITNFQSTWIRGYFLATSQLGFVKDKWDFSLSVDNLTNKRYVSVLFDTSSLCGCNLTGYGRPRTAYLSAKYLF